MSDPEFDAWIAELRDVAEEIYSNFLLFPEDWRDQFDRGRSPHEAFDRIMRMYSAAVAWKQLN